MLRASPARASLARAGAPASHARRKDIQKHQGGVDKASLSARAFGRRAWASVVARAVREPEQQIVEESTSSATVATENVQQRVQRWYEKGKALPNVFTARTSDEFLAFLHAAANFARRKRDRSARAKVLCVKYFAPDCPSCRSLAPKFEKLCELEFADVVFLKVNVRDFDDAFLEQLTVPVLPYVQIFNGSQGLVADFPTSLNAKNLERLRLELSTWRDSVDEGEGALAEVVEAPGWPGRYAASLRETSVMVFKRIMRTNAVDVA
jgi:thiol-disulfide isomerase/thioredoxin